MAYSHRWKHIEQVTDIMEEIDATMSDIVLKNEDHIVCREPQHD